MTLTFSGMERARPRVSFTGFISTQPGVRTAAA
jgi:hypothetical protein